MPCKPSVHHVVTCAERGPLLRATACRFAFVTPNCVYLRALAARLIGSTRYFDSLVPASCRRTRGAATTVQFNTELPRSYGV
jgi:hypothetical protein